MLPCTLGKRHGAALAHRDGGVGQSQGGQGHRVPRPVGAEDLQLIWDERQELLAPPGEKAWLCWVLERAAFVVVPALFHVKNERAKSVGWEFL